MTTLTLEELSQYNGQGGGKAYVALNEAIYDCTGSDVWDFSDYRPGCDLTEELKKDRRIRALIEQCPVVGMLRCEEIQTPSDSRKGSQVLYFFFLIIAGIGGFMLIR